MNHDQPAAGLRERVAVGMLRTAADLTEQRRATVDLVAAHHPGVARDRGLADLALGAWTEQALLWLGWRLLPQHALFGPTP